MNEMTYTNDINWDLVTENTVWEDEKVWDAQGNRVSKLELEEDTEYTIF